VSYPFEYSEVQAGTTSGSFVTVLDVSGSGKIAYIGIGSDVASNEWKITVDSLPAEIIINTRTVPRDSIDWNIDPASANTFQYGYYPTYQRIYFFKAVFKLEMRAVSGGTVWANIGYAENK